MHVKVKVTATTTTDHHPHSYIPPTGRNQVGRRTEINQEKANSHPESPHIKFPCHTNQITGLPMTTYKYFKSKIFITVYSL